MEQISSAALPPSTRIDIHPVQAVGRIALLQLCDELAAPCPDGSRARQVDSARWTDAVVQALRFRLVARADCSVPNSPDVKHHAIEFTTFYRFNLCKPIMSV